jgi:hypothetical protein
LNSDLKKRIIIERFWNKFHYQENIGLGSICAHSLNKIIVEKKITLTTIDFLKSFLFQIAVLLPKNKFNFKKTLFLLPNFSERALSQVIPIQKVLNSECYSSMLVSDFYRQGNLSSLFKWLLQTMQNSKKYYTAVNSIKLSTYKLNLLYTIWIQTLKYQIASDILKASGIKFILVDLDRSLFNSPVICAANKLNIDNATLVHGMVFPPNLYIPTLSKKIYCWGSFHEKYFKNLSKTNTNYLIAGNPSFKTAEIIINKKSNILNIVFASQNFSDNLQLTWLQKIFDFAKEIPHNVKIFIKSHPADDLKIFEKLINDKIVLLPKSFTVQETIQFADLFLVISSTIAFEAIFSSKPVIFLSSPDNRIELANLFKLESNSTIIDNKEELKSLICQMGIDGVLFHVDLQKQIDFAEKFCKYKNTESALIIKKDILDSIEKSS